MREPMDEGDIAQDYQARHNADALAAHRSHSGKTAADVEYCEWCETKIPEARREARPGCTLCINCQAAKERLAAGGTE